jgi:hypothetical protein
VSSLAVLLVVTAVSQVRGSTADSLLVQSVGGPQAVEQIRHLETYRLEGHGSIQGQPITFTQLFAMPDRVLIEVQLGPLSITQAYDGEVAWQRDMNGAVSRLGGYEEFELLKQAYFQSYSYLFDDRLPGSVAYGGTKIIDNDTLHEIITVPFNRDTVLVYLDRKTARQKLVISQLDNLESRAYLFDYREVGGIEMPFGSRAEVVGTPVETELLADTLIINPPVDPSVFDYPLSTTSDFRFPENRATVLVPFEYRRGHIYVTATVNGKKTLYFILDSGSSANVFNSVVLDDLALPKVGTLSARGLSGFEEVDLVQTDSIIIGDLALFDQTVGLEDLSFLADVSGRPQKFGGVIGYSFLSRFPVMVDYDDSALVVYNPKKFEPPAGGSEVPFYLTHQVPTISAELNGIPGDFLVDLGNSFGIIVHSGFVRSHDLMKELSDVRPLEESIAGLGGFMSGASAYVASFAFGDIRVSSLRVFLADTSTGLAGSETVAGNIGNLFLEQFRVLFDYTNDRLIFYRNGKSGK